MTHSNVLRVVYSGFCAYPVLSTAVPVRETKRLITPLLESPFPVNTEQLIRAIPDFPIPGILFRDITPLLKDKQGFKEAIDLFVDRFKDRGIDYVVGIEARGYMLGAPLAYAIGAGFVPVRKPGKLPYSKLSETYALEYGTNSLEIHEDALGHGERVVVVDDLLATGGTAAATNRLLKRLGANVEAFAFLIELEALKGREALTDVDVVSFIRY
jgi:adenine phosphoribosyltransferase